MKREFYFLNLKEHRFFKIFYIYLVKRNCIFHVKTRQEAKSKRFNDHCLVMLAHQFNYIQRNSHFGFKIFACTDFKRLVLKFAIGFRRFFIQNQIRYYIKIQGKIFYSDSMVHAQNLSLVTRYQLKTRYGFPSFERQSQN